MSNKVNKFWSNFKIKEIKVNKINRMTMAKPSPQYLSLSLWLSGNLSDKMEMKITLSIPKITSKEINEIKGMIASSIAVYVIYLF